MPNILNDPKVSQKPIFVTQLVQALLADLNKEGKISIKAYKLYNELINCKNAEKFVDILENNIATTENKIEKNGKLTINKLGGYDEKGTPYLYLINLGFFCNDNVPRREKVRLLEEKLNDKTTMEFLQEFCKKGMESIYLQKAFNKSHHPELENMLNLISAVVTEKAI